MNEEEVAEIAALIEAKQERGWLKRVRDWLKRLLVNALVVGAICVAGGLGLAGLGVDGHLVIHGLFLASPVLAAALLVFLRHAWGQNFTAPPLAADLATTEPASQDEDVASNLASEPSQPVASQPTVTATVLPLPSQPTIPIPFAPAIAAGNVGEPAHAPWKDGSDGDD